MQPRLNIPGIAKALALRNFDYSDLAERLSVRPDEVTKWMAGEAVPVAHRLVRLSLLLDLSFEEIVVDESSRPPEPIVAYRKIARKTTTDVEIQKAREKGRMLRALVPHLPNRHVRPAALRTPRREYQYLQQVVRDLRKDLGVEPDGAIGPNDLLKKFKELGAVLIPVMWGKREAHGNALHILHPDSGATWIFINLDANACDFNFWMSHELAHVFTPELAETDEGEDFADAFAQALLFPEACAAKLYERVSGKEPGTVINTIKSAATDHTISPYTVFKSLNAYAGANGHPDFAKLKIYGAVKNFEKSFPDLTTILFGTDHPKPVDYIKITTDAFETVFFDVLRAYLHDTPHGPGWLSEALEISLLDAKGLYEALTAPSGQN